jgi:hypothetical protein
MGEEEWERKRIKKRNNGRGRVIVRKRERKSEREGDYRRKY